MCDGQYWQVGFGVVVVVVYGQCLEVWWGLDEDDYYQYLGLYWYVIGYGCLVQCGWYGVGQVVDDDVL